MNIHGTQSLKLGSSGISNAFQWESYCLGLALNHSSAPELAMWPQMSPIPLHQLTCPYKEKVGFDHH